MKRLDYKLISIIIIILFFMVICVSFGYAALSSSLKVSFGSTTQIKTTWDIGFENATVNGVASGNDVSKISCGSATATSATVFGINMTLANPGDKCSYTFTVVNSGNIGAKISAITPTKPAATTCETLSGSTMICGNITYKLRYDSANSTNLLNVGDVLDGESQRLVVLTAEYSGETAEADDFYQDGFKFTINYVQG